METKELQEQARKVRVEVAKMFHKWGHGHWGGCYSSAEILSVLYFEILNVDPSNPRWEDRDRFILSKGHAAASLFCVMAERGYFPKEWLGKYGDLCAHLNTHPSMDRVPGLDISSGSLGHGLPNGQGMAYAAKMDKKDYMTYVLLGDGECHEGMIWEAAMQAHQFKLDNLVAIVDRNKLCIAGPTEEWMALEPFADKWKAFGWDVYEVDGHNCAELVDTFKAIKKDKNGKPKVVIANTVKGKGVKMMENDKSWHAHNISEEDFEQIMAELGER